MNLSDIENDFTTIKNDFHYTNNKLQADCCMSCCHSYSDSGTLDCHCKILEQQLSISQPSAPLTLVKFYSKINPTFICDLFGSYPLV